MKKYIALAAAMLMLLAGCGEDKTEKPDTQTDNSYTETTLGDSSAGEPEKVDDETVIAENRQAVTELLDRFRALDYEGALALVREDDRELLDVESAKSNAAYKALLPKMSYETGDSYADGDSRYIDVDITSPSMQDIYGQVFIRMNDAMMNGEITSDEQAASFNDAAILDIVENGDVNTVTTGVRVELTEEDGGLRAALTQELMNAMLGDIQNASQQTEEAVSGSVNEYNQAKEAGVFDGE